MTEKIITKKEFKKVFSKINSKNIKYCIQDGTMKTFIRVEENNKIDEYYPNFSNWKQIFRVSIPTIITYEEMEKKFPNEKPKKMTNSFSLPYYICGCKNIYVAYNLKEKKKVIRQYYIKKIKENINNCIKTTNTCKVLYGVKK